VIRVIRVIRVMVAHCIYTSCCVAGGLAAVMGTNRGVIAVVDLRFRLIVTVWRHSARTPIYSLFPYTTLSAESTQQLACIVATGETEVCVWNLESGAAIALLRTLPERVTEMAARRAPFLTRIPTRGACHGVPKFRTHQKVCYFL
jgi:hypothetical protein